MIQVELCDRIRSLLEEWQPSYHARGVLRDAEMGVDITERINERESALLTAANNLEFEKAALCRDQIKELKRALDGSRPPKEAKASPVSYRKGKRTSGRR